MVGIGIYDGDELLVDRSIEPKHGNIVLAAITEAGVFNAASAGSMFDRVVFPVVNKGADDSLTAVFTFTMS